MKLVKLLLSVIFVLSGCQATFVEKSISKPELPSLGHYKNKPNAYIQTKWINGNPNKFIKSDPRADAALKNGVTKIVNEAHLFNYFTFDKDQVEQDALIFDRDKTDRAYQNKKPIDYTIELIVYDNYDKVWTDWVPITQLFSLGLVPVYATDEFIVTMKVYDNEGELIKSGKNSTATRTWVSWWVLPLGLTKYDTKDVITELVTQQVIALFKECVDQNIFQYK
ncbi:hypothetical protein [Entomomonas asaccharolytica]|uniref:Lipoprotein n=1 Tax=Entomomonas asaccharolytica TaxID=2785331 RepID=A0A974RXS6_9GAMM|nr:hypothetical protein [Entomomonas asaccharolytica]QQP85189.1 hypothetical protein JHT90_12480 [Entomomonas asaccharolytica]